MDLATYADTFVHVKSNNVIGDNLWLWRADHYVGGQTLENTEVPTNHGLIVDADNVIMYGLAVEHTLEDMTVWNGNDGQVYFYQSELPYDGTQAAWGEPGYSGYVVSEGVTSHTAKGLGVYSNFFKNVTTESGIRSSVSGLTNLVSVFLNNKGQITHVVDDEGAAVNDKNQVSYVCKSS